METTDQSHSVMLRKVIQSPFKHCVYIFPRDAFHVGPNEKKVDAKAPSAKTQKATAMDYDTSIVAT
jgi:hypothetical protein